VEILKQKPSPQPIGSCKALLCKEIIKEPQKLRLSREHRLLTNVVIPNSPHRRSGATGEGIALKYDSAIRPESAECITITKSIFVDLDPVHSVG